MNDKKVKQLVAKLKKYRIELTNDEKKSKDFLKNVGILTEKGNFTKNYKHLCIQPEQADEVPFSHLHKATSAERHAS